MIRKFLTHSEKAPETLDWGQLIWHSDAKTTQAKDLVVIEVVLDPGKGHDFHKHPNQEEVIFVIQGEVEQWVGQEMNVLKAGESAFIEADQVHASFNVSDQQARVIAILGPCIGESGYELEEVHEELPWKHLRNPSLS